MHPKVSSASDTVLQFCSFPLPFLQTNLQTRNRHGSGELESGTRNVLVGTLSVKPASRWQRVVSMWRLWGLLSRRVKYVADRGLLSSGSDGMLGATRKETAILPERGLDADGNDPLEF